MGTRHITAVVHKGEIKVAQYGQWDGYPTGQGKTIAQFIQHTMDNDAFRKALDNTSFVEFHPYVKNLWTECGADPNSDMVSMAVSDKFGKKYPEFSRDTGAGVLAVIQDKGGAKLQNDLSFVADSLMCEFAYVVNMDDETVEVYKGFNTTPLEDSERFKYLNGKEAWDGTKYHPVSLVTEIPFNEFTEDAMEALESYISKEYYGEEEEEDESPALTVVK